MNVNHKKKIFILSLTGFFFITVFTFAYTKMKKNKFPFYIYSSYGDLKRFHYHASGRMGDCHSIRMWGNCKENPLSGRSCIKVIYDVSDKSKVLLGWSGVYWLDPANNWGKVPNAGYNLTGAKKLIFHAKGQNGGEKISFKMGGIFERYGDTTEAFLPLITLKNEWQKYEILLEANNLFRVVGGFCWSASMYDNPEGAVFYLDEIYYE